MVKQEFNFSFNGTSYTIAKGGIHSNDPPRKIIPNENEILRDSDIGSQYPRAIIKRRLFPAHLGEAWLKGYESTFHKRIEAKRAKKQSINEAFKLCLNGAYGKLNEETNWQYSPESMYKCTIGNQIEILMLIEKLETNGIHIVSANTDGILVLMDKTLSDLHYKICKEWEKTVGNDIHGNLEHCEYKSFYQTSVNDYLAVKVDGSIKEKGDFAIDCELHKNKSSRIVQIALQQYYINNIPVEDTIKNHKNIYSFCCAVKGKGDSKFYVMNTKEHSEKRLQKINRYFISNDGINLVKRLPPLNKPITHQIDIFGNVDIGIRESEVEAGFLTTIFNRYEEKNIKDYDINYQFYINKTNRIIQQIQ